MKPSELRATNGAHDTGYAVDTSATRLNGQTQTQTQRPPTQQDARTEQRSSSRGRKPHRKRRRRFGSGNTGSTLNEPLLRFDRQGATDSSDVSAPPSGDLGLYGFAAAATRSAPVMSARRFKSAPLPSQRLLSPRRDASSGSERTRSPAATMHQAKSGPAPIMENRTPFQPSSHDGMYHKMKYYGNLHQLAVKESARLLQTSGVEESPIPDFDTFSEFVNAKLGRGMGFVTWLASVGIILGAAMVYHILMKMAINRIVECIGKAAGSDLSSWSSSYAALIVLVVFPFTILKDLRVLVKFNGLGFVFVWYCVLFIVFKGSQALWHGLVNTSEHAGPVPVADVHPSTTVDMVASVSFGAMTGMATLAFFIHNIIHTITKNSDPKVVKRDVVLGYLMAGGVYVLVAVMGAFGLSESVPTAVHLDNILVVYSDSDWYAVSAQMAQVLQLMTVYPLLVLIIRTQVFELLYHDAFPGRIQVVILSAVTMGVTLLFALYIPNVSTVMRFSGAICGLIIIFLVPLLVDIIARRKRGKMSCAWWCIHGGIITAGLLSVAAQFVPEFSQP